MANTPVAISGATSLVGFSVTPPFSTDDVYTFSFPYLSQDDFEIEVQSETILESDDYEFTQDNLIQLTTTGVTKLNGLYSTAAEVSVVIRRRTTVDQRLVDYTDGATLTEEELDLQSNQLFYLAQELYDSLEVTGVGKNPVTDAIDLEGAELIDLGEPIAESSAATLKTVLDNVVTPTYTGGQNYRAERLVFYLGDLYRSKVNIPDSPDTFNATDWDMVLDASLLAQIATNQTDIANLDSDKFDKTGGTISGDLDVTGNSTVGGGLDVTGDVEITGSLTVNGTLTAVDSQDLEITDGNITLNKGGNQASADLVDAGFTVEMSDATDAKVGYDSTVESKFKVGAVGSESEVITAEHTQSMSDKTISDSSIKTPSRLDVKQDILSNLETYAATAGNGQLVFATDVKKMYQVLDGVLTEVGAGGGGGGLSTYHTNDAEDFDGSEFSCLDGGVIGAGSVITSFVTMETTEPLSGNQSFLFTIPASGTGKYCLIDSSNLIPVPRYARNGVNQFSFVAGGTFNSNDFSLFLWDSTNAETIKDSDGNTAFISPRENIGNALRFATNGTENLQWGVMINTDNTGATLKIDNVEFTANPDKNIDINRVVQSLSRSGNDGRAITASTESIPFGTGTDSANGWTYGANGSDFTNGNYYTIQASNSIVSFSGSIRTSTGATGQAVFLIVDGVQYRRIGFTGSSNASLVNFEFTSKEGEFTKGQKLALSLGIDGTLQDLDRDHFLNIVETASSNNVIVANTNQALDRKRFYRSGVYTLSSSASWSTITMDGVDSRNVGNNISYSSGVLNVSKADWYDINIAAYFNSASTSTNGAELELYNSTDSSSVVSTFTLTGYANPNISTSAFLSPNKDYVVRIRQQSGSNVDIINNSQFTFLSINYNPSFKEIVSAYLDESRGLATISPHATNFKADITSSTSYTTMPLNSVIYDSNGIVSSVASNQLVLPKGVYEVDVPVGGYNGSGAIDLGVYDANAAAYIETVTSIVFIGASTNVNSQVTIPLVLDLNGSEAIEFRVKAANATGSMSLGRIKIKRYR